MFFRNLVPKKGVSLDVTLARVVIPVRLGHRDAEAIFAHPLARQMSVAGLGVVTDCRAREKGPNDFVGVELHLGLTDASRTGLAQIATMLEHLHAPCGSSIRLADGGEPLLFGRTEGLELSLDTGLAPDADTRRNFARTCAEALKDQGVFRGWARRRNRTVFYFYGADFVRMQDRLADVLGTLPVKARRMA